MKELNANSNGELNYAKYKVTFIDISYINCIPCKMMQPVMRKIEKNYKGKVNVVFYDVWTKDQVHYAQIYKIRVIQTQIFLDSNGVEFYRQEGYFSIRRS